MKETHQRTVAKPFHIKGNGVLITKDITNKGSVIWGLGVFIRYKYLIQLAVADELWHDGETGKKHCFTVYNRTLFIGWLAIRA